MRRDMEVKALEMAAKESKEEEGDEEPVKLPGFRFHPTDEELVSFYLKRKVEKKPVEVIKPIDIYKYDPWDLPKVSNVGEKEWYFFCMRGRKYRNSIRPNRVTGSGFWKATGIDKPIYAAGDPHDCIGLKKSLVYYRGNAGKGTKTDWMMHEFRLPPASKSNQSLAPRSTDIAQEAEVWTLCRIFKRIPSHKKYTPDPKKNPVPRPAKHDNPTDSCSKTSSGLESEHGHEKYYVSFGDSAVYPAREPWIPGSDSASAEDRNSWFLAGHHFNSIAHHHSPSFPVPYWSHPGFLDLNGDDRLTYGNSWDELRSVVEVAAMHHHSHFFDCT